MGSNDRPAVTVRGLWIGERLSPMEQLSIRSFLAHGYPYELFVYGPIEGVPEGARVLDGNEILPARKIFRYRDHDSVAGFSNHFRYQALYDRGGAWADCDLVCLRPLELGPHGLVVPGEDTYLGTTQAASCFIAAPRGHELMRRAVYDCARRDVSTLQWGDTGPRLLDRLCDELGLRREVRPPGEFCPVPYVNWGELISAEPEVLARVLPAVERAQAVHLWHELWRRAGLDTGATFPAGSLYERLKQRFGVTAAPERFARGAA